MLANLLLKYVSYVAQSYKAKVLPKLKALIPVLCGHHQLNDSVTVELNQVYVSGSNCDTVNIAESPGNNIMKRHSEYTAMHHNAALKLYSLLKER